MEALTSTSNWNLEVLVFFGGEENRRTRRNPSEQRNQQRTQLHIRRRARESNPGHMVGSERFTTAPTMLPYTNFPSSVQMSYSVQEIV